MGFTRRASANPCETRTDIEKHPHVLAHRVVFACAGVLGATRALCTWNRDGRPEGHPSYIGEALLSTTYVLQVLWESLLDGKTQQHRHHASLDAHAMANISNAERSTERPGKRGRTTTRRKAAGPPRRHTVGSNSLVQNLRLSCLSVSRTLCFP